MPVRTDTPIAENEKSTTNSHITAMDVFTQLMEFRQAAYDCLCRAKDATFEMTDAILLTRNAYSLADLSLSPVFRRKWSSIYETTQDTRPQRNKLMKLYNQKIPKQGRIILGGDHTAWSRPDAPTLKERTYEHYAQGGKGGHPVTPGYGYSTIAWIPMPGILVRVSTPAQPPKPRGKSPGWKTGQNRQRRIRYPIVKKRTSPSRKAQPKTA
jgi:hypothetical protein